MTTRCALRTLLLAGCASVALPAVAQTTQPATGADTSTVQDPAAASADGDEADIVITGQTTRNRPLVTASADITLASREDIDRRAPKSTADLLELVPGIFVEGTAGAISNNYSVRGLQGGGQRFVQLEEDGLPILYSGGGADFFFDQEIGRAHV